MRAQDIEPYVGIPHHLRHHDCADLVLRVQAELFGRQAMLPGKRPRPLRDAAQATHLAQATHQLARPTTTPADGDLVLMLDTGHTTPGHAGVYFFLAHEAWVLHSSHALGHSALHRVRDLPGYGLRIEGFYTRI